MWANISNKTMPRAACEKNCVLSRWTSWSGCSKNCDGGTRKRQKFVKKAPVGDGKCPGSWSKRRLQFKKCNMKRCKLPPATEKMPVPVMQCNQTLDVVLLLDGSGSMRKKGWEAEIKAARLFVSAFTGDVQISVTVFSGAQGGNSYKKSRECINPPKNKKFTLKECGINTLTHFTNDKKKVDQILATADYPKSFTLTSLALGVAKAELANGRKNAQSVVVVFTDGRPMSKVKTAAASRILRKTARLMWVPITRYAPLKDIKKWATRRWQENVVLVKKMADLDKPEVITHVVANMCGNPKSARVTRR